MLNEQSAPAGGQEAFAAFATLLREADQTHVVDAQQRNELSSPLSNDWAFESPFYLQLAGTAIDESSFQRNERSPAATVTSSQIRGRRRSQKSSPGSCGHGKCPRIRWDAPLG